MPRFRKKPVEIEAVQFNGMVDGQIDFASGALPEWLSEALAKDPTEPGSIVRRGDAIGIFTLQGERRADPGDWIIRGFASEIYPCKPEIFAATYEPV